MAISDIRSKVYFITPLDISDVRELVNLVHAVMRAGVGMIQYRAKNRPTRQMVTEAGVLVKLARSANVPVIVNDRVDVALAVGADGVHIGQEDMPVADARRIIGPHAILGVTAPDLPLAREAERAGATYISCGPIFPSPTRPEKPPIGVLSLERLQTAISLPICAIGGINEQTMWELSDANPSLVAISSAISAADDPRAAAARLVQLAEQVIPHPTFGP